MSSIIEGLEVAGQPAVDLGLDSEAGFAAALAAKVAATREPAAAPAEERSAPVAPDYDSEAAIKAQLLSEDGGTSVAGGLEVKDGERERIRQDYRSSLEALGIDPDEPVAATPVSAESIELQQLREKDAINSFWERTLDGEDDATALARLKSHASPEAVEGVLLELFGLDQGEADEDDFRWELIDKLEEQADRISAQAELQASAALAEAMQQVVSQKTLGETKQMLNGWARSEGYSGPEARARIAQVEQLMRRDLAQVAQQEGVARAEDLLRAGDALLDEGAHAERVAAFKERFLAEPTTSVSEGLTINAGLGHVPLVPRPEIGTQLDAGRVARRAARNGRKTPNAIKREIAATTAKDAEYQQLQRVAGEMAEALRPKPRTPAGF